MNKITRLDWDSQFFNLNIYKIDVADSVTENVQSFLNTNRFYYIFSPKELKEFSNYAASENLLFQKNISERNTYSTPHVFKGSVNNELKKLAYSSGQYSRFYKDSFLKKFYHSLYDQWLQRAFDEKFSDVIFVHMHESFIQGFVTCKLEQDFCQIELIAVHKNFHGKGIGKKLIESVEAYASIYNIKKVIVSTQRENIIACNFYQKTGFFLNKSTYIYHVNGYAQNQNSGE